MRKFRDYLESIKETSSGDIAQVDSVFLRKKPGEKGKKCKRHKKT